MTDVSDDVIILTAADAPDDVELHEATIRILVDVITGIAQQIAALRAERINRRLLDMACASDAIH